ncbi:MAG: tRNA preQ1(34) S-adenosylmethionine ribosyltransferase-isomerase QueA [Alphaproteobacteria bacterium]|nr:tRNA preQ1(34) S-adenosylmethionine ribosyltransferase-isomerase QueA [Alphaproteobacteria bacterium]
MSDDLDLWDYDLPAGHIATRPAPRRELARLMHVPLAGGAFVDHVVDDLDGLLRPGDLLVGNDSAVMAARLTARRASGGAVEVLLLGTGDDGAVPALLRPARRLKEGEVLAVGDAGQVHVEALPDADGIARVRVTPSARAVMAAVGALPLPPYLGRSADAADTDRYQTVYAGPLGSAAAPTAGLHFTPTLLDRCRDRGVGFATVTLHVGIGTFRPLRPEDVERGELHAEPWWVPEATAAAIAATRAAGGRVIAIGTTATRVLESAAAVADDGVVRAGAGVTRIFLRPGHRFAAVDGLLTNFHLPRSSLMMLVACLVGRERLLDAYRTAVSRGYRFYSYGDAMLLV